MRQGLAPSSAAASPRSSGRPRKYWRIRKVPKAVGIAGRISASSVSESPIPRMIMNTGTIVTCTGTIIVDSTIANRAFLPRNSIRAKTYPAIAAVSICPIATTPVTRALLSTSSGTAICSNTAA